MSERKFFNIDPGGDVLSAEDFAGLSPWEKGYAVYWCGNREDQPNVPTKYDPSPDEQDEYNEGQHAAVIATIRWKV